MDFTICEDLHDLVHDINTLYEANKDGLVPICEFHNHLVNGNCDEIIETLNTLQPIIKSWLLNTCVVYSTEHLVKGGPLT